MTQARFEIDAYTARVLDVIKGKYGLKNREEALKKFVEEHGPQYTQPFADEEIVREMDILLMDHKKKYKARSMSEDDLDELLGL